MDETSTPASSTLLNDLLKQLLGFSGQGFANAGQSAGDMTNRIGTSFDLRNSVMRDRGSGGITSEDMTNLGGLAGPMALTTGGPNLLMELIKNMGLGRPGVINPTVRGNQVPFDPWPTERMYPTRPAAPQAAPRPQPSFDAEGAIQLPAANPHNARLNTSQLQEYNKLPQGGRSREVPEDIRRRAMGEEAGPGIPLSTGRMPGAEPTPDIYRLWQELAKSLGIQIQ